MVLILYIILVGVFALGFYLGTISKKITIMENKKINIAELLENCPKGMELDCLIYDNLYFDKVDEDCRYPVGCYTIYDGCRISVNFTKFGEFNNYGTAKCVIFPKGKTTWEGFLPSKFKDGDVVAVTMIPESAWIGIFKQYEETSFESHCCLNTIGEFRSKGFKNHSLKGLRFASEEEKQRLFQSVKENGYKWNPETKTLEKLVEPKFKVGDIIQDIIGICKVKITEVNVEDKCYLYKSLNINGIGSITFNRQDDWELVQNKFDINTLKTFDKVLMRSSNAREWVGTIYSHYNNNYFFGCGMMCQQCIPYEGNEHLLGKTDDCDEYFKNWE